MSASVIKLPLELTIAQVEQLKQEVMEVVSNSTKISIDDSEITRIDTTGVQLILAIVTHISSLNKELTWQCDADCIVESIKQLGINEPILNQYLVN